MLTQLNFENFKTWRSADIKFGKITGLFGVNSSGKSSIIQFLLLLKQTKEATDRSIALDLNGPYATLGAYKDVIFKHDEKRNLVWTIDYSTGKELSITDPSKKRTSTLAKARNINTSSGVTARGQNITSTHLRYDAGVLSVSLTTKGMRERNFVLSSRGGGFRFKRTRGRPWQLPGPIKSYAYPDQARTYFQNASFLADLEAAYEEQIDAIFYLGPLREFPQRDYLWARTRPRDVGIRGEKAIDAILAATIAEERRNIRKKAHLMPFQEMIAYWLAEMGLIWSFKVEEIAKGSNRWQAKVQVRENGSEALLTDVGFGVSQVLPVITLLQYVPSNSTVILEQPEIHLHPLAQANLADVIINAAVHRNVQIILESHSEHFLLRLQRRIAEGKIDSGDVRMYFCEYERSSSSAKELDLDLLGNITNWPKNFMGDAFSETYAAEKARIKRGRKSA